MHRAALFEANCHHRKGHFMTAHAHTFPAGPTLEALRIQREAYAASGGEAAVTYDKLGDELVLARQRLSDQEKWLATARLDLRTAMEVPQGRQDATEAAYKELGEAEQRDLGG